MVFSFVWRESLAQEENCSQRNCRAVMWLSFCHTCGFGASPLLAAWSRLVPHLRLWMVPVPNTTLVMCSGRYLFGLFFLYFSFSLFHLFCPHLPVGSLTYLLFWGWGRWAHWRWELGLRPPEALKMTNRISRSPAGSSWELFLVFWHHYCYHLHPFTRLFPQMKIKHFIWPPQYTNVVEEKKKW